MGGGGEGTGGRKGQVVEKGQVADLEAAGATAKGWWTWRRGGDGGGRRRPALAVG